MEPLDQRGGHRVPVHDVGPEPARVKHETHGVEPEVGGDRRLEEQLDEARRPAVGLQDVPVPVDHDRRVGLLLAQDEIEGAARLRQRWGLEVRRAVDGRVTRGRQEVVPVAERDIERPRQQEHHLPARLGPARLDEAQVARRDAGIDRPG